MPKLHLAVVASSDVSENTRPGATLLRNPNKNLFMLCAYRISCMLPCNQRAGFARGRRILSSVSNPDRCFPLKREWTVPGESLACELVWTR